MEKFAPTLELCTQAPLTCTLSVWHAIDEARGFIARIVGLEELPLHAAVGAGERGNRE